MFCWCSNIDGSLRQEISEARCWFVALPLIDSWAVGFRPYLSNEICNYLRIYILSMVWVNIGGVFYDYDNICES